MPRHVIIVGTGVAGLSVARALPPDIGVMMLSKGDVDDGATPLAMGGIAVPMGPDDNVTLHVHDTLVAGRYLNHADHVASIIAEAQTALEDLLAIGFEPDRNADGSVALGLEGGHSRNRIVHARDRTGRHLHDVLLRDVRTRPNVRIATNVTVERLVVDHGRVIGVDVADRSSGKHDTLYANAVVLATGGSGALFERSTNPPSATGDGVRLAHDVGARISNLEHVQWHPTAMVARGHGRTLPLVTEALRGAGARLVDTTGRDVVHADDHAQGCLAPRDVVTAACFAAMHRTKTDHVFLDARHLDANLLRDRFPTVVEQCMRIGIDPSMQPIPVAPAAHYQCGGITTDLGGRTTVAGLYAVGECADVGLHGMNRLASNSLLEGLVMGRRCGQVIAQS
jgi:L-aspartate oxidase